jgi:hypothetical protein
MLERVIHRTIRQRHTCLIVHPGIKGDRGASSLDRAIELGEPSWGVTILQAVSIRKSSTTPDPAYHEARERFDLIGASPRAALRAV